jgi:hypothetical protein
VASKKKGVKRETVLNVMKMKIINGMVSLFGDIKSNSSEVQRTQRSPTTLARNHPS